MANRLISTYEQQYGNITAEITSKINQILHLSNASDRDAAISHVQKLFIDGKEILEQIDLESRSLPASYKLKYANLLKSYQAEQGKLEKDFLRAQAASKAATDRDELLDNDGVSSDMRETLLNNTDRIERTGNRLNDGFRTIDETERVGHQILSDLGTQRESLQRSRDRLKNTNQDLGSSSRVLSGMLRRIIQNRVLLILIIAVMLIVVGMVIYVATRSGDQYKPAPPKPAPATTLPLSPTPTHR